MTKESYFTPDNIHEAAEDLLQCVASLRRYRAPLKMPLQSALLVLDMQEYFLDPASHAFVPSARSIIPGIQKLITAYSQRDKLVIFTQHINTHQDAGMMSSWWSELIVETDPFCELTDRLTMTNANVIKKCQYDAFFNTDLEEMLVSKSVTHVVICGVMTHLCCETTARSAFMRGFDVWFAVDGTATYNKDFHQATLLNLSHGFATPVLVDEVLTALHEDE
ncbi:MAG: isochorismatase family protein [Anaerolineales bacterium]